MHTRMLSWICCWCIFTCYMLHHELIIKFFHIWKLRLTKSRLFVKIRCNWNVLCLYEWAYGCHVREGFYLTVFLKFPSKLLSFLFQFKNFYQKTVDMYWFLLSVLFSAPKLLHLELHHNESHKHIIFITFLLWARCLIVKINYITFIFMNISCHVRLSHFA